MLNNIQHKNLRVVTRPGAQYGDNVGIVMTFPTEYADVQREYPIFFRKDSVLDFGLRGRGFRTHAWIYALCVVVSGPST